MNNKFYMQLMIYPIILIILSSAIITSYHIYQFSKNEKSTIDDFSNTYLEKNKKKIYEKVQNTVLIIDLIKEKYESNQLKKKELINNILVRLKKVNLSNKDDLFIVNLYNINGGKDFGKVIYSNNKNILTGKLMSDDTEDTKYRKDILNKLKKSGELYHKRFSHNRNIIKSELKHIYIFHYKPLNLVIGSGFYLEDLNNEISIINKKWNEKIRIEVISTVFIVSIFVLLLLLFSYLATSKITKMIKNNEQNIKDLNNTLQDKIDTQVDELRSKDIILSQKSKAQSLGEMLTLITHQWRQPLNVINSITAKMYKDCKLETLNTTEVKENVAQIEELTSYMSQTMSDFNSFYKLSKQEEYFQLNDVVNNTINILFPRYYKDIKPNIEFIYEQDITLYGFKSQMQQILLSILNNSIENFKLKNTKAPKIKIKLIQKKDIALINIEDNGGGIKELNLNKVFDLYYSTKEKDNSRGMGLYIAKMMSQACLRGDLTVNNTQNGAIFTISCGINAKK